MAIRLTTSQLAALKTDLAANTTTIVVGGTTFAINNNEVLPTSHAAPSDEAATKIAAVYNALASPTYAMWHPTADKAKVDAQVLKSAFTPSDTIPVGAAGDLTTPLLYANRAMLCQLKQTNAQWLTLGVGTIDARDASVRTNFKDCLRTIPSGTAGADSDAGWGPPATPGTVRLAMQHSATVAEKLLGVAGSGTGNTGTDARGATTNPDVATNDNNGVAVVTLTSQDIKDAWTS